MRTVLSLWWVAAVALILGAARTYIDTFRIFTASMAFTVNRPARLSLNV